MSIFSPEGQNIFSPAIPVLLVGPPGVGKTAMVQGSFGHTEKVLCSTMVEEDVAGLPYREGQFDYRTIPGIFQRLYEADSQGKTTVLFLDELDKARRSVADTLLTLVASRHVGSSVLPAKTCIAAAVNPPEFGGGDGVSEAMLSRFCVVEFFPNVMNWTQWAESQFGHIDGVFPVLENLRSGRLPIFDMVGEGFNRRITCPRTFELVFKALAQHGKNSDLFATFTKGLLTSQAASQVLNLANNVKSDVMDNSLEIVRSAVKNNKNTPILRL